MPYKHHIGLYEVRVIYYSMNLAKIPSINYCCNFMINFSICIWKNLIIILDVKIKHGNYLITSVPLFLM